MTVQTWKAKVKLSTGAWQEVTVQADNFFNAKAMLENQYGKGKIMFGPSEVR